MKTYEAKIQIVREASEKYKIITPEAVKAFWESEIKTASWYREEQEQFVVLNLDGKNQIKNYNIVSIGILNASLVHPREVFRPAIMSGSGAVICCHNHPSGDPSPSSEDIKTTKQLIEAGKIIAINVLDHVIIGDGFHSLRHGGTVQF